MKDVAYDDMLAELYRENPKLGLERLNSVFEDGDEGDFVSVLDHLARAFEGRLVNNALRARCVSQYQKLAKANQGRFSTIGEGLAAIGLSAEPRHGSFDNDGLFVRLDAMWRDLDEQDKVAVVNFAADLQRGKAQQVH